MRPNDRIYRTFEEFEREELRRMETVGGSVSELMGGTYDEELDFNAPGGRSRTTSPWDDDEE